jgi:hypothetical protein
LLDTIYSPRNRIRKLLHDVPPLVRRGAYLTVLLDAIDQYQESYRSDPARTYVAGTDREPPEAHRVPLTAADFASQEQRDAVMEPWRVTDAEGRVLPAWLDSRAVYERKGRIRAPGPVMERVPERESHPLAHT